MEERTTSKFYYMHYRMCATSCFGQGVQHMTACRAMSVKTACSTRTRTNARRPLVSTLVQVELYGTDCYGIATPCPDLKKSTNMIVSRSFSNASRWGTALPHARHGYFINAR
eukprot:scaffold208726_cov19-Prasinocladus_malaysianus.AAC.1